MGMFAEFRLRICTRELSAISFAKILPHAGFAIRPIHPMRDSNLIEKENTSTKLLDLVYVYLVPLKVVLFLIT